MYTYSEEMEVAVIQNDEKAETDVAVTEGNDVYEDDYSNADEEPASTADENVNDNELVNSGI